MNYEWDAANIKKHDVSFEEAQTVFYNQLALIFEDELHLAQEHREIIPAIHNKIGYC